MRFCYLFIALIIALLIADMVVFDGRHRGEFWQEAKEAGSRVNHQISHQLRRAGLGG
jgi:hypothetical protein